jgi:hypothetical protein
MGSGSLLLFFYNFHRAPANSLFLFEDVILLSFQAKGKGLRNLTLIKRASQYGMLCFRGYLLETLTGCPPYFHFLTSFFPLVVYSLLQPTVYLGLPAGYLPLTAYEKSPYFLP